MTTAREQGLLDESLDCVFGRVWTRPELDWPDVVGEQVADAIVDDTFMVYTHSDVREILVERASDWNAFVAAQTEKIATRAE